LARAVGATVPELVAPEGDRGRRGLARLDVSGNALDRPLPPPRSVLAARGGPGVVPLGGDGLDDPALLPDRRAPGAAPARPAAAGGPVGVAVGWDELDDPALQPGRWTIRTRPARLAEAGDPLAHLVDLDQRRPPL